VILQTILPQKARRTSRKKPILGKRGQKGAGVEIERAGC